VSTAAPTVDRATWPRVTEVICAAGLVDVAHFTDFDRDRGTAVHECARLVLEGTLDRSSVDPVVAPRLAQFERFLIEARPDVHAVELEVHHETLRYKGRLDLLVGLAGHRAIVDIKGPTRAAWHGVQTAAYQHAVDDEFPPARYTLHLSDTDYRLVQHTDRQDWARFVTALKAYRSTNGNA
jgi:hypothetical protein